MKKLLLLTTVLMLAASAGIGAPIPERFKLTEVRFIGVKSVSKSELTKTLAARTPPRWRVWQAAPILIREDLEDDRLRIQQYYRKKGYYKTQVSLETSLVGRPPEPEPTTVTPSERDRTEPSETAVADLPRLRATFTVTEGPPVLVKSIDIDVDRSVDGVTPAELAAKLPLKPDRIFAQEDYEESKDRLGRTLGNRGYPFAEVAGKATIDPSVDQATVTYRVTAGPLCFFGPVVISQEGSPVSETVLRRALAFKEGERFSEDKVDASRRRLFKLDVFRSVVIQPGEPPAEDGGKVPLQLQLKSKSRHNARFGIGYGSEDGLRLQASWTYRNILGRAGSLSLGAKRSDLLESLQLTYEQPYILDARNNFSAKSGFERAQLPAYTNRKIFADAALTRNFAQNWIWQLSYGLENNRVERVQSNDPEDIAQLESKNNYLVSFAGFNVARDTRDNLLNPSTGSYFSTGAELAPELLGSEIRYVKPALEYRRYWPILDRTVLSGRFRLETIQGIGTTDTIPIIKRLFLGGSNTVRGYGFQELPPLDTSGDPLGGQTAFNANLEVRFPLYKDLSGVTFLDAGLLDAEPFKLDIADMRYSAGIGLRYDTVVGPIRLDFGYKLNPLKRKDIGDFTNPDDVVGDRWRIHLSIGQAF